MSYAAQGRQYIAVPVGFGAAGSWFGQIPNKLAPEIKRPSAGNAIMVLRFPSSAEHHAEIGPAGSS